MPLALSNLHGFNAIGGGVGGDALATYRSSYTSSANATHYVSGALAIGPATSNKTVIVVVTGRALASGGTIDANNVTIGGVAATEFRGSSAKNYLGIWGAVVPGVATATVDVNFNDTSTEIYVDVFSVDNLVTMTVVDDSVSVTPLSTFSDTISIPAGGMVIAGASAGETSSHTWTGLTEAHESAGGGFAQLKMSSAFTLSAPGDPAFPFSVNVVTAGLVVVAVSLR